MRMSAPALVVFTLFLSTAALGNEDSNKVLMIFSKGAAMGNTVAKNNLWEYAEPHHVFVMHGYTVNFVSPGGLGDVKLSNGEYLVKRKPLTGFPNSSEQNSKWTSARHDRRPGYYCAPGNEPKPR
jgi:hypothetical protein